MPTAFTRAGTAIKAFAHNFISNSSMKEGCQEGVTYYMPNRLWAGVPYLHIYPAVGYELHEAITDEHCYEDTGGDHKLNRSMTQDGKSCCEGCMR